MDIDDWEPILSETMAQHTKLDDPIELNNNNNDESKRNIPKRMISSDDLTPNSDDIESSSEDIEDIQDEKKVNGLVIDTNVDNNNNDDDLITGDIKSADGLQSPSFLNNMFSTFRSSYNKPNETGNNVTSPTSSPSIISHRRQSSAGSKMRHSSLQSIQTNSGASSPRITPQSVRNSRVNSISSVNTSGKSSFKDLRPMETITTINSNTDTSSSTPHIQTQTPEDSPDFGEEQQPLSYNPKKFVEEKYLDTEYHYASIERNNDFHILFTSIPKEDRLIDDFSCALSREFLYQGRIYITETHVGFNSNILGWTSKVIVPFKDITYMEKTSSAGVFQNAISIETEEGKTQFINFISRDGCFGLMKEVLSRNLLAHEEEMRRGKEDSDINPHSLTDTYSELIKSPDLKSESYPTHHETQDNKIGKMLNVYRFNQDSPYKKYDYEPHVMKLTQFPFYPPNENKIEHMLTERTVNCTPNQAFQIMFNEENHTFLQAFLESTNSNDIKLPGVYKNTSNDTLIRNYSYSKSITGIPGGSTDCLVTEEILHNDPSDYIMVINDTKTPNVPSGGAFSTKTRYLFKWGVDNKCDIMISFWVEWTGSSWIKSMVEAGCKNGQNDATTKMMKILNDLRDKYIESEVIVVDSNDISTNNVGKELSEDNAMKTAPTQNGEPLTTGTSNDSNYTVFLLIVIAILLFWNIYNQRSLNKSITNLQKAIIELQKD
ncbi:hypothetical protein C6P45_000775 [Maudiozyma exigua]|uniref:VASt domain-containing protein n=1 Tax=Maudiozyma exigua TaxID=34358 RepID=A0A9P6WDJ0_MAUEX|nr:hypothetical protein C6P45_000775 [Kazachstania exigua]